jgi:hypothetical protein
LRGFNLFVDDYLFESRRPVIRVTLTGRQPS